MSMLMHARAQKRIFVFLLCKITKNPRFFHYFYTLAILTVSISSDIIIAGRVVKKKNRGNSSVFKG